jgi:hypothetical protein
MSYGAQDFLGPKREGCRGDRTFLVRGPGLALDRRKDYQRRRCEASATARPFNQLRTREGQPQSAFPLETEASCGEHVEGTVPSPDDGSARNMVEPSSRLPKRERLAPGNNRSVATTILLDKPSVATAITECSRVQWIRNACRMQVPITADMHCERLVLRYQKR